MKIRAAAGKEDGHAVKNGMVATAATTTATSSAAASAKEEALDITEDIILVLKAGEMDKRILAGGQLAHCEGAVRIRCVFKKQGSSFHSLCTQHYHHAKKASSRYFSDSFIILGSSYTFQTTLLVHITGRKR